MTLLPRSLEVSWPCGYSWRVVLVPLCLWWKRSDHRGVTAERVGHHGTSQSACKAIPSLSSPLQASTDAMFTEISRLRILRAVYQSPPSELETHLSPSFCPWRESRVLVRPVTCTYTKSSIIRTTVNDGV